uniref:Enoyl-CoA delta isomerase 2 n=1 Tax=Anolis carolinensis TaxID=28377 RepID=R4G960_ANOCA|nr:PREDICTED: enoyl-CoA delta isomerase 2, mitochondrial isoform X1 [Anolis carolinensis]|eukprot:XP_016850648.1 PREDICTED: enoyl-CoA delta isomerase 2, mitochondrial isoform X1 [Anolis carolinensis]
MTDSAESKGGYKTILVTTKDKITKITLNRPHKKNALNLVMYREIQQALEEAAKDDSTLIAITGCGDYFSSGNDLYDIGKNMSEIQKTNGKWLKDLIGHFIDFPKPLIALVNGHAIGLGVALLGLCDIVYASDKAVFQTRFTQLGLCPEGCSSHTFPKIMGATKANEMLIFNKKITAEEACVQGLVTEVFSDSAFQGEVWTRLKAYANLPKNSLAVSKQLIRSGEKEILHAVASRECDLLVKRCFAAEFLNILKNFVQKSKL